MHMYVCIVVNTLNTTKYFKDISKYYRKIHVFRKFGKWFRRIKDYLSVFLQSSQTGMLSTITNANTISS